MIEFLWCLLEPMEGVKLEDVPMEREHAMSVGKRGELLKDRPHDDGKGSHYTEYEGKCVLSHDHRP